MEAPDDLEQAKAARVRTRDAFLDAVDQGVMVREVTGKLKEHARRNHFGISIEQAWSRDR